MTRETAKDLTLSILVIAVLMLAGDCIWLHAKTSDLTTRLQAQTEQSVVQGRQLSASDEQANKLASRLGALEAKVESHLNPPPEPTLKERAKGTYVRMKAAAKNGYEAVKGKILKE